MSPISVRMIAELEGHSLGVYPRRDWIMKSVLGITGKYEPQKTENFERRATRPPDASCTEQDIVLDLEIYGGEDEPIIAHFRRLLFELN